MIKKALIFIVLIHTGLLVLQSCCNDPQGEIVGAYSYGVYSFENVQLTGENASDAIRVGQAFKWYLYLDYRRLAQANTNSFAAYATQTCEIETWVNELDTNSFKIYFDQSFVHESDTLENSSNLLPLIRLNIAQDGRYEYEPISFEFDSTFMNKAIFDTTIVYTLHFEGFTSDNIALSDSIKIKFDLP